jgi:hypothetical protein
MQALVLVGSPDLVTHWQKMARDGTERNLLSFDLVGTGDHRRRNRESEQYRSFEVGYQHSNHVAQ